MKMEHGRMAFVILAAIALAALLAAPWYESTLTLPGAGGERSADISAWEGFDVIDVVIVLGASAAAITALLRKRGVSVGLAGIVLGVIVYRLIDIPGQPNVMSDGGGYTIGPAC
jgi:hypothetical protein